MKNSLPEDNYRSFLSKPGWLFNQKLEEQKFFKEQNCASVCDYVPLFYIKRSIMDGNPEQTCTNAFLNVWISEYGPGNKKIAMTVSIFIITTLVLQLAVMVASFPYATTLTITMIIK